MVDNRTAKLRQIRDEILNLKDSPLYEYRQQNHYYPVIGEGNHYAKIVFIGEAPGQKEAETGHPFCGPAGKILDQLLASVNIKREEVYITNVVKDRPPGNRDPESEEIKLYSPFLVRQLDIIKPPIIATLGRFSMKFIMELFGLLDKLQSISHLHGQVFDAQADYGEVKIIIFYHPAVAIYNPQKFSVLKQDFQILTQLSPYKLPL